MRRIILAETILLRWSGSGRRIVGGIICAIAAPLYIPAWRQERANKALDADPGSIAA
jgi:hypothetical protein